MQQERDDDFVSKTPGSPQLQERRADVAQAKAAVEPDEVRL
jgi:hypothetical protein